MAPAPPVAVETPFGVVRAGNSTAANEVAEMLTELHPLVEDRLPGSRPFHPDVWVQESLELFNKRPRVESGLTLFDVNNKPLRIHVRENSPRLRNTLTHELTHALMGPEWDAVSGAVEEGVCEVIAAELNPQMASARRTGLLISASSWFGGLSGEIFCIVPPRRAKFRATQISLNFEIEPETTSTSRSFQDLLGLNNQSLHRLWSDQAIPEYHGLGFVITARILRESDLRNLLDMCIQANELDLDRVPTAWILNASHIRTVADLREATVELFRLEELEELARFLPGEFAKQVASFYPRFYPGLSMQEFLEVANPKFRLGTGMACELRNVSEFVEVLAQEWP